MRKTFRVLREFYGRNNRPAIRRLVNKFKSNGTVTDTIVSVRQRNACSEANIAAVNESVYEKPKFVSSSSISGIRHFLNINMAYIA